MDKFKWLLQDLYDADDGSNGGGSDPNPEGVEGNEGDDPKPDDGEDKPKKKYTDEEVNDIVDSKFAKWKKELEDEKKKAARRAKLSEDERIKEEKKELEDQIEEYKRKELVNENAKKVSNKLSDAGLPHDDELITMITSDDEDVTQEALNVVIDYVAKIKKNNTPTDAPTEGGGFKASGKSKKSMAERAKEKRIIKN